MDKFAMKGAARTQRRQAMQAPDRIALTLEDIAEALEEIARLLAEKR